MLNSSIKKIPKEISVAPMMDITDRHYRYFMRLITQKTLLYTEMVHTNQLIYGNAEKFLQFAAVEDPVVLQLGGSDPKALAHCSQLGEDRGYHAINLNLGCPSERVQKGSFGACLLKQKQLVATCIDAMRSAVAIPVTVKTRLGIDELDSETFFFDFIETLAQTGCTHFIIHARKAWLKGLNPKQNRSVPPLDYQRVYKLKRLFPELTIVINGGIRSIDEISEHLQFVDGVMLGRVAYNEPFIFSTIDTIFFASEVVITPLMVLQQYIPYVKQQLEIGTPLNVLIRPILGLFHGKPYARKWRGFLTTAANKADLGVALLDQSLAVLET